MSDTRFNRRQIGALALASLALPAGAQAARKPYVADMHSHYGMFLPRLFGLDADEIMRMCDLLGPDHVAFGTDMEGVWPNRMLNDYADLRDVVENLQKRGVDTATLHQVFIGNYARLSKRRWKNDRTHTAHC